MTGNVEPKIILTDYLQHLLIRTPLNQPVRKLQLLSKFQQQTVHPEMQEIDLEPQRIETVMRRIIKTADNCIDVGCHFGSTLNAILRYAPAGHHLACEPTPHKAKWLRQKFPEVDILELAAADKPGKMQFHHNKNRSGASSLRLHQWNRELHLAYSVRCELLDNLVDSQRQINFIRIDVEGGELAVLKGATKIIREYQPTILFECTQLGLANFGFSHQEIFDFFREYNYAVFLPKDFINRGKPLSFEQFERAMQYPFQALNFIAQLKSAAVS